MPTNITGRQEVINNLLRYLSKSIDDNAKVVELTTTDIMNHAKAGHLPGAHAKNRYQNVTTTLTRDIFQKIVVDRDKVTGIVFTSLEYAPVVEFGRGNRPGYPFMFPALRANVNKFRDRQKRMLSQP